jgi:hypothetical protein
MEKAMRKFLVALLSVLCLTCFGLAAACSNSTKYYTLTYDTTGGITYTFEGNNENILSGAKVKKGFNVVFEISLNDGYEGVPVVMVNDTEVKEDENGKYSFSMTADTTVSVSGIWKISSYDITFNDGDTSTMELGFIEYLDPTTGEKLSSLTVEAGDEVSFKLHKSVYYGDKFTVLANTEVLEADKDGIYTFTPVGATTVEVTDLDRDQSFYDVEDGGSGTAADPFKISRPIDLYMMYALIGNSFYNGQFALSYYELTNDIDMQGERVYVIGDDPDSGYFFGGNFNGNGHKISNYYMIDTKVDQDEFGTQYLQYVGFFGAAAATSYGAPEIYNLTLDNFEITINAARYNSTFVTGGLVGWSSGANITGCTVNGKITIHADDENFGFAGGLVGYQQSTVSSSGSTRFYSSIRSCVTDVDIEVNEGYAYAVGGIAGYMVSYQDIVSASILNCYTSGSVIGAMSAGGIVGYAADNTLIKNCYTTGDVVAYNTLTLSTAAEQYFYANAGGIAGYAGANVLIADCFSTATVSATADKDSKYQKEGGILGNWLEASTQSVSGINAYTNNCYSGGEVKTTLTFFKNTLGWSEGDWVFAEGGYPTVNYDESTHEFAITLNFGEYKVGSQSTTTVNVKDRYIPLSYWYVLSDEISQYYDADQAGYRSYGLFFDSSLTKKVPVGYIPTGDITLYVGFANYAEVAGEYAISTGSDVSLTLGLNGVATFRKGAMSYLTDYSYNGKYVIIYETCIALASADIDEVTYYDDFRGDIKDGVITISGIIRAIVDSTQSYVELPTMTGVKKLDTFTYGTYVAADGSTYVFNANGTGLQGTTAITYSISGNELTINSTPKVTATISGNTVTISGTVYTAHDIFAGTWEKSATTHKQYTFDGVGGWSYVYFGYSNGSKVNKDSKQGTYTINADGNKITLLNADSSVYATAIYDSNTGFVTITIDGVDQTYYGTNSYVGNWTFNTRIGSSSEYVELAIYGITKDGIGKANVTYQGSGEYALEYNVVADTDGNQVLTFYYYDTLFGQLVFNTTDFTLEGSFYSNVSSAINESSTFFMTDDMAGEWISDLDVLALVEFNGYGTYSMSATLTHYAVNGTITINGKSAGSYKLNGSTMEGSFVYNNVTYNISYNEQTGMIDVTYGTDSTATLQKYDEWKSVVLTDGNGTTYTFDGKGALISGGTLTVTTSSSKNTYNYTLTADGISANDGNIVITKDLVNNSYALGTTTLKIKNSFTGNWYLSASYGATMTVGEIGAKKTATGTFLGTAVEYTYDESLDVLTFTYSGSTLYVSASEGELTISTDNSAINIYAVAISAHDSFFGKYAGNNGYSIRFDGFGASSLGVGVVEILDKNDTVSATYYYSIDTNGDPVVTIDSSSYLFTTKGASTADESYTVNGTKYTLRLTDKMYLRSASDDDHILYSFDGLGTLTTYEYKNVNGTYEYVEKATYSYTVDAVITTYKHIVITITSSLNTSDRIVYSYTSPTHVYFIDDLYDVSASGSGFEYTFDGMGGGTRSDDKEFTYVITKIDTENDTYYVTITDTDGERAAVIVGGEDGESNIIRFN